MKCPYCAEEIQDGAIKCKHCGEWLPKKTYFYPAKRKKHGDIFEIEIEGEEVKVEYKSPEAIIVSKGSEKVGEIPADKILEKNTLKIANHSIDVQYRTRRIFFWNSGLMISVDSKPVVGTLLDPRRTIRIASYAIFYFAFLALVQVIQHPDLYEKIGQAILLTILVVLGIVVRKIPIVSTLIGILYGIYHLLLFVSMGEDILVVFFGIIFRGGATLLIFHGLLAAVKLRNIRRRIDKNRVSI